MNFNAVLDNMKNPNYSDIDLANMLTEGNSVDAVTSINILRAVIILRRQSNVFLSSLKEGTYEQKAEY